jgi:hypothetical protein
MLYLVLCYHLQEKGEGGKVFSALHQDLRSVESGRYSLRDIRKSDSGCDIGLHLFNLFPGTFSIPAAPQSIR